jgi:saxitoxin biosynthesis operon SxtJ-like protein
VLGWINTRIILGVVFYFIVTPIGLIRRWLGKDSMGQHLRPDLASYRITRKPRTASHLTKQY